MTGDAPCNAVFGRRGSGKTTLTRQLVAPDPRIVVFDPVGQWAREFRFQRCDSLEAVRRVLKANWGRGFRIAYVPTGDYARMLHGLAALIWHAQAPYEDGIDPRHITLVAEEMNLGYPASKLPENYYGMSRVVLQGRHRGIKLVGVTQRPAEVSATFRGNVDGTYILPLSEDLDTAKVLRQIGREHQAALRALKPHEWLYFHNGRVTKGKNKKPR